MTQVIRVVFNTAIKMKYFSYLFFFLGFLTTNAIAVESIQVVGLFPGKVVLVIDGQQKILAKGQEFSKVRYIKADGDQVVLEIEGVQKKYKMGSAVSTHFKSPAVTRKTIYANSRGMFYSVGSINGQVIHFLVDTGATTVAMSSIQAKKLNIRYRLEGQETTARTASGIAKAYRVNLKSVKVGSIAQKNVVGLVIDGAYPTNVLLGMSFLNRLKVEKTGDMMVLEAQ